MKRVFGLVVLAALVAACGGKEPAPTKAPAAAASLPAGLRLETRPEGAPVGVGTLKKTAKEGQEVLLRARIGGSVAPFVEGYPVMTVADADAITSCAGMEMGKEGCKTPWDYCCTSRDVLLSNTATVRVAGPGGKPLAGDFRSLKGIEPLKVVLVKGVVGPRPDPAVLVVDATGIFVE